MSAENLQSYTYEYLMNRALSYVSDDLDKREGSIIYDALAPFCQVLAAGAMQLSHFYEQTYVLTATSADLDNRVAEHGISRHAATYAVKKVVLTDENDEPVAVPIGTRFSTISTTSPINYAITAQYVVDGVAVAGTYEATCEEPGIVGNEYSGNLINLTFVQGLASAVMSTTLVPARDEETDEELRERYLEAVNQRAFGGNISDYRQKVEDISGVGALQVYPVWNGGGTVKLSIVDPSYGPCSQEFIARVQEEVDPENAEGETGTGLGIAPIGHKVTVVTPDEVDINISATVLLVAGTSLGQVQPSINSALEEYIQGLRREWATSDELNKYSCCIYVSRVTATLINVAGITNVSDVTINGSEDDFILTENSSAQQLPKLGEVTISAQ